MSKTETCKYNAQSRMSEAKTKGQMLNVGCEKMSVHSTVLNLKVEFENLTVAHEKLNVESDKKRCDRIIFCQVPSSSSRTRGLLLSATFNLDLPDFSVERNVKSEIGFVTSVTFRKRV